MFSWREISRSCPYFVSSLQNVKFQAHTLSLSTWQWCDGGPHIKSMCTKSHSPRGIHAHVHHWLENCFSTAFVQVAVFTKYQPPYTSRNRFQAVSSFDLQGILGTIPFPLASRFLPTTTLLPAIDRTTHCTPLAAAKWGMDSGSRSRSDFDLSASSSDFPERKVTAVRRFPGVRRHNIKWKE